MKYDRIPLFSSGKALLVFSTLILYLLANNIYSQNYGLEFKGYKVPKDERTELDLSHERNFSFDDEFELSFDFQFNPNLKFTYGYIFRIILDDTLNIDLVYSPVTNHDTKNFNVVLGHKRTNISFNLEAEKLIKWQRFRFKVNLSDNKLILFLDDASFIETGYALDKDISSSKIIFGVCDYGRFKTRDVPSMRIKDIKIYREEELKHHWPLNEKDENYATDIITDIIEERKALVRNPDWIKQKHQVWSNIFQKEVNGYTQVAANIPEEKLYLIAEDQILIYSAGSNSVETIKYKNRLILQRSSQAIYDPLTNHIYSYNIDNQSVAIFDFNTRSWKQDKPDANIRTEYWHHNKYFSPYDTSLYIFGGYGHHEYKNEVQLYTPRTGSWTILKDSGDFFKPRYMAASGGIKDSVFILGGYGSPSRKQIFGPENYFDLMAFSLKEHKFVKKFDFDMPSYDMSFANSLVIEPDSRSYFALAFPTLKYKGYLQLIRGSLNTPSIELLGNELPYIFKDTDSFADLFFFPQSQKLITFISYLGDSSQTELGLYSIHYPPNHIEGQIGIEKTDSLPSGFKYATIFFGILLMGLALVYYVFWKAKFSIKASTVTTIAHEKQKREDIFISKRNTISSALPPKKAIFFFGGFRVYNEIGDEITHKFTPLLKELFLLIWFSSLQNNKGISSEKLAEILWFGKSSHSARNNRAVNIAKLRSILSTIGQFELTHKTGYWKIIFSKNEVHNDYINFLNITGSKVDLTKKKIHELIEITKQGPFLTNLNYEWLDEYKAFVAEKTIDTLLSYAKTLHLKKDASLIIQIADDIFNFDSINEEAMVLKSKALIKLGMHSLSKTNYQKFSAKYKILYNQEYEKSFVDIAN